MKNILLLVLSCLFYFEVNAQTTVDFEEFYFDASGYNNNMSGGFEIGNISLPNNFTQFPNFSAWDGWAISSVVDTETPGFLNEFAVISGSGYDGSSNYAVSYKYEAPNFLYLTGDALGAPIAGFYINNSTYAYLSMLDGDSAAKKFGGETGEDEDFFLLTINGYQNGALKAETVAFYLADYRFADNSMDYIINEWTYINLLPLGNVDSLAFRLTSSDVGEFGMNTPAYFCVDNITTTDMVVSTTNIDSDRSLYLSPNPAIDQINIEWPSNLNGQYFLYNSQGQQMGVGEFKKGNNQLLVSHLSAGAYFVQHTDGTSWNTTRFLKL